MTTLIAALLLGAAVALVTPSAADDRVRGLMVDLDGRRRLGALLHRLPWGPWAKRSRARRSSSALQALSALAAELRAGQPPIVALREAAGAPPAWPRALAAARAGGDVAAALREDAVAEPMLIGVGALWQLGADRGSGLVDAVDLLARTARQERDVQAQLDAHLAGPRATARVLAVLPVIGIAFGFLLGAHPLAWLLGTGPGLACLLLSAGLIAAGLAWTSRIAARVGRAL